MSEVGPVTVRVDQTNPGQFFACCGLLEMADRLWRGAEGTFTDQVFSIRPARDQSHGEPAFADLMSAIAAASLRQVDIEDDTSSPIAIDAPFALRIDWWRDDRSAGQLKVWAGRMSSIRIARAMQNAVRSPECKTGRLFDHATVVYDADEPDKKVEPFYFDARRGANARALDVGFMPDALNMTTAAYPAVEFLALIGLQRCRPAPTATRRVFEYATWAAPLPPALAAVAAAGLLPHTGERIFRFESAFRTDQRKHKAFAPATEKFRS